MSDSKTEQPTAAKAPTHVAYQVRDGKDDRGFGRRQIAKTVIGSPNRRSFRCRRLTCNPCWRRSHCTCLALTS